MRLTLTLASFVFPLLLVSAASLLNEREYDAQVAPPTITKGHGPLELWQSFRAQLRLRTRQTLKRFHLLPQQPQTRIKIMTISTTEAPLQFYGALNPIFQEDTF